MSTTGIISAAGYSSVTFSPTAGQPFTVVLGATASGQPIGIQPTLIMRSEDGTNFTPAQNMVSSITNALIPLTKACSVDVMEQRSGVTYAVYTYNTPVTPYSVGFYQ